MRFTLVISCVLLLVKASAQESYVVTPVDLTPMGQDYAPTLMDSTVVMCSLRDRGQMVDYRNAETGDPFSDLYAFNWSGYAASTPNVLSETLISPLNDGPATFAMGGTTICFTRNLASLKKLNKKADNDRLGLFFSARTENGWSEPVAFDYNSADYSVMHPAFSADGKRLFFASDMPGGSGGVDLYVCELSRDGWDIPVNLGPTVNSEVSDVFPFVSANNVLYFASKRDGGEGGLDIYKTSIRGGEWSKPEAMPAPINSPGNDLGYASFVSDRSGFLSSDRDGSDRIYSFRKVLPFFASCPEQMENNYCYSFDEPKKRDKGELPVHYRWDMGDGTTINDGRAEHCYKGPGHYIVTLDLVDDATGTVFFNEAKYDLVIDDVHQPYITCGDTARSGRDFALDAMHTYLPGTTTEEFRWDLGDGSFADGRSIAHDWKAPGEYLVKVDVQGIDQKKQGMTSHCVSKKVTVLKHFEDTEDTPVMASYQDSKGAVHEFNFQALPSDQHAMSVQEGEDVKFSVELFASKERLSLNDPRFTEIKKFYPVYERYDPIRGQYTYSVGQAKDLEGMYEIFTKVKQLQFLDAEVVALHMEKITDMSALELLNEQDLNNSVVRASTVLFDNGLATFAQEFEPQLDKIQELLMKHTTLNVVIEAHTDANGGDDFNLKLSQQRAESIIAYLTGHGVKPQRLVPVGHGENHPIADNKSTDGRAQNRRVEFRLVMRDEQAYERRH